MAATQSGYHPLAPLIEMQMHEPSPP